MFRSSLEHSVDDSATLTAIESCPSDESECRVQRPQDVHVNTRSPTDVPPEMGPFTFEEHTEMLQEMVQKDFMKLQKCKNSSLKYQAMYEGARVMMDVEKVLPLFKGPCGKKGCQEKNEVVEQKLEAGDLTITYQCKNGHRDIWYSFKALAGGQIVIAIYPI